MFKYTLAVTSPEYWNTIHVALTHEEAVGISTHPQVKWIELSPTDYPEAYPDPEPAT